MDRFINFLLNEQKHYLGEKSGDILTALQNLQDMSPNLSNRALMKAAGKIVERIRKILHGRWEQSEFNYLKQLQKVAIALSKAVDDKEDMESVVAGSVKEIEDLLNKLEMPINTLGTEDVSAEPPEEQEDFLPSGSEMRA